MKKNINILIGDNIRKLRMEQNISQEELADRAELHRNYIGIIERAEKNLSLVSLEKIARALKVDIRDLFGGYKP